MHNALNAFARIQLSSPTAYSINFSANSTPGLVLLQNRYSVRWNTIELAVGVFNELFSEFNTGTLFAAK